jgi:hypothetical protein
MAKKFNPEQWLEKQESEIKYPVQEKKTGSERDPDSKIETIISRIESQGIDITGSYDIWRDIGFAFADEFGESGREYFHRISKFYPDYSSGECDDQFDKCLKSNGHGITMNTFYHFAKMKGVNISGANIRKDVSGAHEKGQEKLPLIADEVYATLPDFLQKICDVSQTDEERDILLLGSLATLSSIMPNVYGFYHQNKVKPNMYLFLTAKASAGKGLLNHCKQLAYPVHYKLREESEMLKAEYQKDLKIYNANKRDDPDTEKPQKPPEKLLFIPANSSATGVFQLLSDNDGKGLIFETEGDTLANTFKSDYGNYSDGFRKAFHHETISYYRRTDKEYVVPISAGILYCRETPVKLKSIWIKPCSDKCGAMHVGQFC